ERSRARVGLLRESLGDPNQPDLDVIGCSDHLALARELAERSVTLVRDDAGLLPVRADIGRVAVVRPRPKDLTPADTSSLVIASLAAAIRRRHQAVDEFVTEHPPTTEEISQMARRAADYGLVVVGTLDASRDPLQA